MRDVQRSLRRWDFNFYRSLRRYDFDFEKRDKVGENNLLGWGKEDLTFREIKHTFFSRFFRIRVMERFIRAALTDSLVPIVMFVQFLRENIQTQRIADQGLLKLTVLRNEMCASHVFSLLLKINLSVANGVLTERV